MQFTLDFQVQISPLLARSNLIIARDIEWSSVLAGFEQVKPLPNNIPHINTDLDAVSEISYLTSSKSLLHKGRVLS